MATPREIDAMRRAIALSALGLGTTSPNPPVGCVILDAAGRQVGAGYHQRKGEPHAETHALTAAGDRARGGTAVVTLEPCNHVGVTPACRQALLDAHISRVIIAIIDPTSRGEGGAAALKTAGVDVEIGVLADEARLVLEPWLVATQRQRPWVTVARVAGDRPDISFKARLSESGLVVELRQQFDVVVGADGRVAEGIPGGHGQGRVNPPATFDTTDPAGALTQLYQRGVRTVLTTDDAVARDLLAIGAVDRVVIDVLRGSRQDIVGVDSAIADTPGFHLDGLSVAGDAIRLDLRAPGDPVTSLDV